MVNIHFVLDVQVPTGTCSYWLHRLRAIKIVGDSIQDGIPSPDNPVEIKHKPKIVLKDADDNEYFQLLGE